MAAHGQRENIIDSGASNHLVAMHQLHEAEKRTIKSLPSDRQIQCASGAMTIHKMAQLNVPFLKKAVWAYVMKDCPTILSLGILCNDEGWNYSRRNGQELALWRKDEIIQLYSKQKVPMIYAAASTGNDHSPDQGSRSQPESVNRGTQQPVAPKQPREFNQQCR